MTWSQTVVLGWLQFVCVASLSFWGVRRLLRYVSQPADRLRLIEVALFGVVLLAVFLAIRPWSAWRWEILPTASRASELRLGTTEPTASIGGPEQRSGVLDPAAASQDSGHVSQSSPVVGPLHDPLPVVASTAPAPSTDLSPRPAARHVGGATWWTVVASCIVVLHLGGLLYFAAVRLIGGRQWRRLCRDAWPATDDVRRIWDSISRERGTHVRLLVSPRIEAPLLFGWLRPVVMIPRSVAAQGAAVLRPCLAHEWAHAGRRDFLVWRAVDACQCLLWLVPDYWALRRELRLCQDMLADHWAAHDSGDAVEYSALLVSLAQRQLATPPAGALTLLEQRSQLMRRVTSLLDSSRTVRSRSSPVVSLVGAIGAIVLALIVSSVSVDALRDTANAAESGLDEAAADAASDDRPPASSDAAAKDGKEVVKYRCRVVDKETGQGLAGAKVVVRRSLYADQRNEVLAETRHTTDATGQYDIEIPPAQAAEDSLYIELDVEHPDYAGKKGFGYSFAMIRKNEKLGERPFFERTELHPGAAVTGTVLDPAGAPLAGAKIQGFSMASANDFGEITWAEARTDEAGKFRIVFHQTGDAILWVIPKGFAVVEKFLAKQRGEMGELKVPPGVRLTGRVLGVDGQPLAGIPVNLNYSGERDTGGLPVATSVRRGMLSDADGRFAFDPLPAGDYRLTVDENVQDPLQTDRPSHEVPAVFVPRKIVLKAGDKPTPVEIQAVPQVVVHAQYLDSSGKKTGGHDFFLHGQIDGQFWNARGRPDRNGTIRLLVPHGLQETQMQLMTNEHGALRYRRTAGDELQDNIYAIQLGTLNDDIEGFEIIRYRAPIVALSAVDEAGSPIAKLSLAAKYAKPRPQQYVAFENMSDIRFERQEGGIYRSTQMLPDEDVTLTIGAEGYESRSERIKLAEGKTQELKVKLSKSK